MLSDMNMGHFITPEWITLKPNSCEIITSVYHRNAGIRITVFNATVGSNVVAVKSIGIEGVTDGDDLNEVAGSMQRWRALRMELLALFIPELKRSKYITQIQQLVCPAILQGSSYYLYVVMESGEADLGYYQRSRMDQGAPLSFGEKRAICYDAIQGLYALHEVGIAHGDLKPKNVLIFQSKEPGRTHDAKLADFGNSFSADLDLRGYERGRHDGTHFYEAPEIGDLMHGVQIFATNPVPPEEILFKDMRMADFYSLGILIWQVLCDGNNPFASLFKTEIEKGMDLKTACEDLVLPLKADQKRLEAYLRKSIQPNLPPQSLLAAQEWPDPISDIEHLCQHDPISREMPVLPDLKSPPGLQEQTASDDPVSKKVTGLDAGAGWDRISSHVYPYTRKVRIFVTDYKIFNVII
ncbi:Phytochrome [Dactylella cylindrospora]|nr:Phytochrome [Dactylella cylindrospora]